MVSISNKITLLYKRVCDVKRKIEFNHHYTLFSFTTFFDFVIILFKASNID